MSFLAEDEKLSKKYNEIWSEIKKIMKRKKFSGDLVFGDKLPQILKMLRVIALSHLKKESNAFACQLYLLILFSSQVTIIINRHF